MSVSEAIDVQAATTATEPIPSYRPDAKTRRYDRQLRLWASTGQRSLESARILLVGDDGAGCQTLKNLILPGIAHFTILSPRTTTGRDLGPNFFLHPDSIGHPIAEQEVSFLKELNPAVEGTARVEDPAEVINTDPDFFLSFTLIIVSNIDPALELKIADLLWEASESVGGPDIPLVAIRDSGFVGRIEIQLREHCINDTHPDTTHTLRVDTPFPTLEAYARGLDLETMDSMEHSHVPWVVLLVRAGTEWRDAHGGKLPETSEEKDEFKELLKKGRRKGDEENYDEAVAQAHRAWSKSEVPYEIKELLSDPSVHTVSSSSKNLHILLHTLSKYIAQPPYLTPISPSLPDMHSSTASYIALQNLYKAAHTADLAKFTTLLEGVLSEAGMPVDTVPSEEVEGFVRNVAGVGIVKGRPMREAKSAQGLLRETIENEFGVDAEPQINLCMYMAILASERFYAAHGRWPGHIPTNDVAPEVAAVEAIWLGIVKEVHPEVTEIPDDLHNSIAEVVRFGFASLPTTAAFLGGIAAQEVIKLVTNQYTPLDNVVVADMIKSVLEKFKF